MRLFILATAAAAMLGALSPAGAVKLPGAEPEKLTALPDDWLDRDVDAPRDTRSDREIEAERDRDAADAERADRAEQVAQREEREDCPKSSGTTGAILGAVAGGLLGSVIDGGDHRTLGTLVGAGGGALLGRDIEQKRACKIR